MDNFNKTDDLYDPNFSINNDNMEKLDMYGVWLKKKKDTVEAFDSDTSQTTHASREKNQDIISFDDNFSFSDMDTDMEVPELEELNDMSSLDTDSPPVPSDSYSENDTSNTPLDEDGFESLDLDDFLSEDGPVETESQEEPDTFVEEEPINLDFTEMTDDTKKSADNTHPPAGLENFSEISLEDFEDADSTELDSGFEPVDDFDDFLKDDTTEEQKAGDGRKKEAAVLDINVVADDETTKIQTLPGLSSQVVEDDADLPIFGTNNDSTGTADSDAEAPAFFDDVEAVKQDLLSTPQNNGEPAEPVQKKDTKDSMNTTAAPSQHSAADQDKATELLIKIAQEISDLKAELNSLKAGMAAQSKVIAESSVKDAGSHQEEKHPDTESSGFFSDDDTDETIALTGDELNNILITADFTEERNAEDGERIIAEENQAEEASEDYEVPPVLTKDIDPDMEETPPVDSAFEESIAEPQSAEADNGYTPEGEGEKLLASDPVFNVEAAPITSLPEDLSYLDEPSEAADSGEGFMSGDSSEEEAADLEEIEEAEPAEDETDFEDINVESFDIPSEQEIEVPEAQPTTEAVRSAAEVTEERTIHELQNDEDFPNLFADTSSESDIKETIAKESFIGESSAVVSAAETAGQNELIEELEEIPELESTESGIPKEPKQETLLQAATRKRETISIPLELKNEIKSVLSYMDQLLEALPEKKIEEFAQSEYFETYKHLFEELGIS